MTGRSWRAAASAAMLTTGAWLAGCAAPRVPVAVVAPPPPPVAAPPALPPGASPGMLVPAPLADGSFPTPNRQLFGDAAVWHLRAGLNVAALSCAGAEGEAVRAAYNRWLLRDRAELGGAQRRYAAGYAQGDAYDDAMTRLYNFFSQTPVRGQMCRVAAEIAAELDGVDAAGLPAFAQVRLAMLDRPFVDFYAAYDAWRRGAAPVSAPVPPPILVAAAAPAPVGPAVAAEPAAPAAPPRTSAAPARLVLDLSTLPADDAVAGPR